MRVHADWLGSALARDADIQAQARFRPDARYVPRMAAKEPFARHKGIFEPDSFRPSPDHARNAGPLAPWRPQRRGPTTGVAGILARRCHSGFARLGTIAAGRGVARTAGPRDDAARRASRSASMPPICRRAAPATMPRQYCGGTKSRCRHCRTSSGEQPASRAKSRVRAQRPIKARNEAGALVSGRLVVMQGTIRRVARISNTQCIFFALRYVL